MVYIGLSPCPVTVTTRIIIFLVGDPCEPSFATVTVRGDNPSYIIVNIMIYHPLKGKNCICKTPKLPRFGWKPNPGVQNKRGHIAIESLGALRKTLFQGGCPEGSKRVPFIKIRLDCLPSWWFQPIWKICSSNWIISPGRGENKKYLKPPPSYPLSTRVLATPKLYLPTCLVYRSSSIHSHFFAGHFVGKMVIH